jgi:hypothetical protein
MGVVEVKVPDSNSRRYITAVQQSAGGSGNPGCATTTTLTFPRFNRGATEELALPYGAWKIYAGNTAGSLTQQLTGGGELKVLAAVIEVGPSGVVASDAIGKSALSGGIVTLDPRQPA